MLPFRVGEETVPTPVHPSQTFTKKMDDQGHERERAGDSVYAIMPSEMGQVPEGRQKPRMPLNILFTTSSKSNKNPTKFNVTQRKVLDAAIFQKVK